MQNSVAKKLFAVGSAVAMTMSLAAPLVAQAAAHPAGTNVITSDGTVWMITSSNTRRAYTSGGAFLSYGFNSFATVQTANADDLALPVDPAGFIPPQDGSIICSDRSPDQGTCYLITNGKKAGFVSQEVFTGLGFSFANAMSGDVSFLSADSNIENTTAALRTGVITYFNYNGNKTYFLVGANSLLGIPSNEVFNSWGYSFSKAVPANAATQTWPVSGVMVARQLGQLSPSWTSNPQNPSPTPGSVTVGAASNQTPPSTVPKGATNVNFLKFVVYNGGTSAATVNQVTVKRTGAGSTSDLTNVYLYQGASRLTSGRSVNSSTNEAVFSGLNVNVPAGGSITMDVLADIYSSATAGNVHQLMVTSVMLGSTQASGTASGNSMTLAGVSSGTVTIAKTGSITNPKVGEQNVRVGSFTLAASSSEDVVVKRISLYQGGAVASSNLTNLVLKQAGNTLATVAALDSEDKANFEVNFALAKGDTKTFEVYANVSGGSRTGSSETVKFYLEESTDLFAVGQTYGFGTAVTSTDYDGDSCTSSSGDCSYSYVEGGQLTITFNGPSAKDIAKNGKDVEVFNFTMAAQNNLEIRQLAFVFNNGGSGTADFNDNTTPNYTDVKVVDATTGAVVFGPQDLSGTGSATSQTLTFTEDVFLAAGTSKTYKVTLDVANNSDVTSGDVIGATLDVDSLTSNDVKNTDNNTFLTSTDIVPTSDISGNQMTVRVPSLTVALAATPTSKSFVKGSTMVEAAGYVFTASTAADVKVTDLTLTGMIASAAAATMADGSTTNASASTIYVSDNVVTVELYDGATKIGQTKSPSTAGTMTFNGLNWVVPKGSSKTLVVKMTISNSANSSNVIKWKIASSSITAVDPDGNSVTDSTSYPVNGSTTTTVGTAITITGAGTITVATAGNNEQDVTDARIVTAGKTGVTLGKIRFTAVNEELKLTKARIAVATASSTAASAANIADDITALYLYDGSTLVAGPVSLTPSGTIEGYADFTGMTADFIIGKDASKNLTVKADLNTISNGADSGDEFAVWLDGSNNFEVRGTSGSTTLTAPSSGSYVGSYVVLRKSQPKVETVAMTSSLGNGTQTLYRFKVTAVDNDIALKHITFTSSSTTGVSLSSFAIAPQGGSNLTVTSSATYAAGSVTVDITFNSEELITSGSSKTYDFKATVAGADTGDSVTTSIATTDTAAVTGDLSTLAAAQQLRDQDDTNNVGNDMEAATAAYNFIWSDMSATSHSDTAGSSSSDDWTNGRYVRTIPTDSQGLSLN